MLVGALAAPVAALTLLWAPAAGAADGCPRGRVLIRSPERACITVRSLAKGLPATQDALFGAIVRRSGTLWPATSRAAAPLPEATREAFAGWEARLAAAGRIAARGAKSAAAVERAAARTAQSGSDITLGLEVAGPLGWGSSAVELVESLAGRLRGGLDSGRRTEQADGTLTSADGTRYTTSIEDGKPSGVYCPKQNGIVEATGVLKIKRTFTVGRSTRSESFIAEYKITGHVDSSARLKSYDVQVKMSAQAGASRSASTATATGIEPRASRGASAIVPAGSIRISAGAAPGTQALAAAAIAFAQRAGLEFVQDAEQRFHDEASCLEAIPEPSAVKRGATKQVKIRVKSRITGRFVESNLTLTPGGGASVNPARARTTPSRPAHVTVEMPRARGSRARAAAGGSVAITGREQTGRARGSIGSDGLVTYEVVLDVHGQGVFGAWNAFGELKVRLTALPLGSDRTRWEGVGAAVWTSVILVPNIPCQLTNPVGADTLNVAITALPGGKIQVRPWVPNGAVVTATVTCPPAPPIPGEPALSLIGVFTTSFEMPEEGGITTLAGAGLSTGTSGFINTGTLTVTRKSV